MVNKYICLLILIISTHFSFSQDINKQKLDGVVAIVGDEVLFYSELNESMLQYSSQNNLNLSNIKAHENIELAINKIITNFTTKSARKNRLHNVKSEVPPSPTT